ncbi:MAG: SGNH hydrolase domain-containing protein, partial [Erythrobacter sp.]
KIFAAGERAPLAPAAGARALTAAMQRLADRLPRGTRIVLIGNVPAAWPAGPQVVGGWPRCRAYINAACPTDFPAGLAQGIAINAELRALAARDPRFTYVDSAAPLCRNGRCLVIQDGTLNYWDPHHLTLAGARRVVATMPGLPATLP